MISKAEIEQFQIAQPDIDRLEKQNPDSFNILISYALDRKRKELTAISLDLLNKLVEPSKSPSKKK